MPNAEVEFEVYHNLIKYLKALGWQIICASPPAGTDTRFRRCLLPRRDITGSEKGPRDEVDLTAIKGDLLIMIECKSTLSEALTLPNALGEPDVKKLGRLVAHHSPEELVSLLERGLGVDLPSHPVILPALAVASMDSPLPRDIAVFEITATKRAVHQASRELAAALKR